MRGLSVVSKSLRFNPAKLHKKRHNLKSPFSLYGCSGDGGLHRMRPNGFPAPCPHTGSSLTTIIKYLNLHHGWAWAGGK